MGAKKSRLVCASPHPAFGHPLPRGEGRNHQENQPSPSGERGDREAVGEGIVAATNLTVILKYQD